MNEFDIKAAGWDKNPMHQARSEAVVSELLKHVPVNKEMKALEFGAGTGIAGFLLKDYIGEITLMDNSREMVNVMNEKLNASDSDKIKILHFNLQKEEWMGNKFDLILTQMALHHITDVKDIINKFHRMLNPGACLAIADLYAEDGSFHGEGFTGHKGFDINDLSQLIINQGFNNISHRKCFTLKKEFAGKGTEHFDVFLLTAYRNS